MTEDFELPSLSREDQLLREAMSSNRDRAEAARQALAREFPERWAADAPFEWQLTLNGYTEESVEVLKGIQHLREQDEAMRARLKE